VWAGATKVVFAGGARSGRVPDSTRFTLSQELAIPMIKHRRLIATLGCLAALGSAGAAVAADGATDIKVQAAPTLTAGRPAPFDAPGVRAIRRGKPIPRGYQLIGQQVDVQRGAKAAGAALIFRCPQGSTLRTFGIVGNAGFSAPRDYAGHRQTTIVSFAPPSLAHATGTVYAVCR
jgi:hypothetical protein